MLDETWPRVEKVEKHCSTVVERQRDVFGINETFKIT